MRRLASRRSAARRRSALSTDITAPTAPSGVTASGATQTAFTVYWTGSTDAVGVTTYEVQVDGVSVVTTDGDARSAPVTGHSASTTYSVRVRARDAAGNWSALSNAATITTASAPTTAADLTNESGAALTTESGSTITT